MKNDKHVPGSKTLMPVIIKILQDNGRTLSFTQVLYMVMFQLNLPIKSLKKAHNEVSFSGTYLRKIGALKTDDVKKGEWVLTDEFMNMDPSQLKKISYERYNNVLGR